MQNTEKEGRKRTSYNISYSWVQKWASRLAPPTKHTRTQDLTDKLYYQPHSIMADDACSGADSPSCCADAGTDHLRGRCILLSPASSAGSWRQQSTKTEATVRIKWVCAQRDSSQCVGHSQWAINAGAKNAGRGKSGGEQNQKRYALVLAVPPYKLKKLAGHSKRWL